MMQETVPLLDSPCGGDSSGNIEELGGQALTPHEEENNYEEDVNIDEFSTPASMHSYKYEPPRLLSPSEKLLGGLRGSRPLVKLDRMSFIAKMAREGKDGESMGDYAPDSRMHSINLGETSPVPADLGEGTSTHPSQPKISHLSSAYPTLNLKDLSLIDIIGGGGFGQVWRGTWGGTPVAVKLLSNLLLPVGSGNHPPNAEQEALLTAFEEEVSMLAQLRHPNICLFLGVCLEPPHRAIVTELVGRGSLWDCLRVKGLFQVLYNIQ